MVLIKEKTQRKALAKSLVLYGSAGIVPMIVFSVMCMKSGIYPFGNYSNLVDDLSIQYVDLFSFLKNMVEKNNISSYSFSKGLGGNIIGVFAYYLASPVNALLLLFRQENIQDFVYCSSCLKLGLCGVAEAFYLRKRFPNLETVYVFLLSLCFSLSFYNISKISNLMWLDGVYMLPLIMCGAWKLVEKKEGLFLTITVACSVVFNWYTAYMNCLFVIIYFCFEYVKYNNGFSKNSIFAFLRFFAFLLWGVLLSAVLFFPNIYELLQGKGGLKENIWTFAVNGNFLNIMRGFVLRDNSASFSLFCGTFAFILALDGVLHLYRVRKREFYVSAALIGIMILSLLIKPLENIWNGFRYAYSYSYRYSYVQTWMIVYFAAVGLIYEQKCKRFGESGLVRIIAILFITWGVLDYISPFNGKALWATLVLAVSFAFCLYMKSILIVRMRWLISACIVLITVFELVIEGEWILSARLPIPDSTFYPTYVLNEKQLINTIKQTDQSSFFRIEQTLNRGFEGDKCSAYFLENMGYDYNGISHYSSATYERARRFLDRLGYGTNDTVSMYDEPILAADSLLGIKYIMADRQYPALELKTDLNLNGKRIYENPFALPLGFLAAGEENGNEINFINHFQYQNEVYSRLLGEPIDLYKPAESKIISHGEHEITFEIELQEGNILYGFANSAFSDLQLYIDDQYRCRYSGWLSYKIFNISDAAGVHKVKFENFYGGEDQISTYFYQLDLAQFDEVVEKLRTRGVEIERFENGIVEGTVTSGEDGFAVFTIPSEKGWSAAVNGESVPVITGVDALIMIPVKAGVNQITLTYKAPYVRLGLCMSILSFIGILVFIWRKNAGCRAKQAAG